MGFSFENANKGMGFYEAIQKNYFENVFCG